MNPLVLTLILLTSANLSKNQKIGRDLGKEMVAKSFKEASKVASDPSLKSEEPFDAKGAKEQLESSRQPENEATDFLLSPKYAQNIQNPRFHHEEGFLNIEASQSSTSYVETQSEQNIEVCREGGEPLMITTSRRLDVNIEIIPEVKEKKRRCLGHKQKDYYFFEKTAKKGEKELIEKFKKDPRVKSYHTEIIQPNLIDYVVVSEWEHIDNASGCKNYKEFDVVKQRETFKELSDSWVYEDPAMLKRIESPEFNLIKQVCVDADSTKIIKGHEVTKPCWKEELVYLQNVPKTKGCDFLRKNNCSLIKSDCLQRGDLGCILWEHTFKCLTKLNKKTVNIETQSLYGSDQALWDTEYEANRSFSDVFTKLSVFNEIEKELEGAKVYDVRKVEIFKGKEYTCSKSIADKLMYDCCVGYSGLAKDMKLAKCDENEIALSELRERGQCHYVGKRDKEFMNLWKSRDEHVYCCFPSKLSRVFQEEARKQLGLSWGSPEKPVCRGILNDEIASLNFSNLELSEAFETISEDYLADKFQNLEERISSQLSKIQEKRQI